MRFLLLVKKSPVNKFCLRFTELFVFLPNGQILFIKFSQFISSLSIMEKVFKAFFFSFFLSFSLELLDPTKASQGITLRF